MIAFGETLGFTPAVSALPIDIPLSYNSVGTESYIAPVGGPTGSTPSLKVNRENAPRSKS